MRPGRLFSVALVVAALASCSSSKKSLTAAADEPSTDEPVDGGADDGADGPTGIDISTKPQPDAACGYESIDAKQEPANLYLVIDRSGSMAQAPPGSATSKYGAVGKAVVSLVKGIGWRSKISLTLFPNGAGGGQCLPGAEVLPLQPGDPKSYLDSGKSGPVAQTLQKIFQVSPAGGTPTGATLAELAARPEGFGKNSYVLLATDGAPNCNPQASCDADHCIVNIEQDSNCPAGVNCCDPSVDANFTPANCIDRDATLDAVLKLSSLGVKTIVIGIPGSEKGPYAETLSLLAVAGGAPRPGEVRYYRVEDIGELESLLTTIGSEVLVSCDVSLSKAPDMPDEVNIYFDDQVVPYDENEGWTWSGPQSLTLHGKACDTLLSGSVGQIQMLVGCPTATVN